MKEKYYLFGGSGHGKVVADILISSNINVDTILDDHPAESTLLNIPIIPTKSYVPTPNDQFIIAIGNNAIRKKIVKSNSFSYFKAIAPAATVSQFAEVGEGTMIMPKAVVNAGTKVGKHCIMNSGSIVEHDCVLEDYVHVSPNAAVAGHCTIGEGSQIGMGANVIQCLTIGKWVIIGAGAVIIRDVPDYAVVVGNPGRIIKFNKPE